MEMRWVLYGLHLRSIRFTGFVGESPCPVAAQNSLDVVGRVIHLIAFGTVAQLQDHAIAVGSVLEMMC